MKPVSVKRKDPRALERLLKNVVRVKGRAVEVGFPNEDEMHRNAGMTVKELALTHEFGTIDGRIPARPFIQPTMHKNRFDYRRMMFKSAKDLTLGRKDVDVALKEIGERAVDDMRLTILEGNFTPLAESTIAKKGHSHPLIESDQMYDAIDYKVK